jgi:orotate phosphoribosyltransferase-like protein
MAAGYKLTEKAVKKAVELRRKGLPYAKIGAKLGVTGRAIAYHCEKGTKKKR